VSAEHAELAREYMAALETYLRQGDEPALSCAYELGRRAMIDGWGVLEVAVLHSQAVRELVLAAPPGEQTARAEAATAFFHELLSPYEMALRGYRSANEELRRLNETLRQQKDAVERANRELESFSYSVSHDLRAPLRRIDGFSQAVLEDCTDKLGEKDRLYLGYVREAAQRMGQLIDDLLSLARVARGDFRPVEVDLSALARGIADRLGAAAPERAVVFSIEEGLRCQGDPRFLSVLLENLLGNAWKFTSKRATAEIAFGRREIDRRPTYFVSDNGAGFDMRYAEKLFGVFQRLHSAEEFDGTGIGLATVQRIVQRHDGRIWAEGKVDGGATFYFTLGGSRPS
jgi:light-regulated signal transduction histidine kinase (bacteriophytochrome)